MFDYKTYLPSKSFLRTLPTIPEESEQDTSEGNSLQLPMPTEKSRKKPSRSARAGLVFPVGEMHRTMCKLRQRISADAAIYTAGVVEYLVKEMMLSAGLVAHEEKQKCITPLIIKKALDEDEELAQLIRQVVLRGMLGYQLPSSVKEIPKNLIRHLRTTSL